MIDTNALGIVLFLASHRLPISYIIDKMKDQASGPICSSRTDFQSIIDAITLVIPTAEKDLERRMVVQRHDLAVVHPCHPTRHIFMIMTKPCSLIPSSRLNLSRSSGGLLLLDLGLELDNLEERY